MKRRHFLQLGGFALAGGLVRTPWLPTVARAVNGESAERGPILVVLVMQGGNDGLNTVVPYRDSVYYYHRPNLAVPRADVLPLTDDSGLHPALAPLTEFWDSGDLAVLRGVGYPNMNLSHFRSTDIVWSASGADRSVPPGWLARWLEGRYVGFPETLPAEPMALQQGFAAALPLQGELGVTGVVVDNPASFQALIGRTFTGEFEDSLGDDPGDDLLRRVREIDAASFAYASAVSSAAETGANRVSYPHGHIGDQLATIARLVDGDLGTPVYLASLGSFDTHAAQPSAHRNLLASFANAVNAFFRDLKAMGRADDVVLLTVSEFGRRVHENASAGTDHGTAAPWFAIGRPVLGGVYGSAPDLETLDPAGNLLVEMDYREVYASFLRTWFGTPRDEVDRVLLGDYGELPIVTSHPSNPSDPEDPGDPEDPDDPGDPGDPEYPGDPGGPSEPLPPHITRVGIQSVSPNPGGRNRTVVFDLPAPAEVRLELFDARGRRLRTFLDASLPAGRHQQASDLGRLAEGLYFLRLVAGGETRTKKVVVR